MPVRGRRTAGKATKSRKPASTTASNVVQFPDMGETFSCNPSEDIFQCSVELEVGGTPRLARKIQKFLEKELPALPGVVLRDDPSYFLINVSVVEDNEGRFGMSHFIGAKVGGLLRAAEGAESIPESDFFAMFGGWIQVTEHSVRMGPMELLEAAAADIVERFDREYVSTVATVGQLIMEKLGKG